MPERPERLTANDLIALDPNAGGKADLGTANDFGYDVSVLLSRVDALVVARCRRRRRARGY